MADPMQQARELLAAEIGAPVTAGSFAGTLPAGVHADAALRAIAAALRAAPEGFVMVPVQTLESIRDSSTDPVARGFAEGALAARPQGVKDA